MYIKFILPLSLLLGLSVFSNETVPSLDLAELKPSESTVLAKITSAKKRRKVPVKSNKKRSTRKYFKFSSYSDNIDNAKMSKVLNAYLDENYEEAIEHASQLVKHERLRRASNYYIALSLAKLGYLAASIHHFGEVIKMDVGQNASSKRYYQQAVNSVLKISDEIKDDSLIPHLLKNVSFN